ncbi:hypothetical protein DFA_00882 [Cavenderia fasciculata]|uniref:Transmembrane protein n=1 Tax=Cavenderia fasciculata TaxID=261658 RepID=F4PUE1_CACFS|nr:uncharacterized protein DFA_00882 [Cavenderia fasciculata]EGG21013.1 hypothetical protein DFA_00882 [Cavenderia fasciculata]|eukprot:XP_004358863.1 hypothetical protein DFA_00882 [Cavenderia fasciculata]
MSLNQSGDSAPSSPASSSSNSNNNNNSQQQQQQQNINNNKNSNAYNSFSGLLYSLNKSNSNVQQQHQQHQQQQQYEYNGGMRRSNSAIGVYSYLGEKDQSYYNGCKNSLLHSLQIYVLRPFLIGLSGSFGLSVGYILFDYNQRETEATLLFKIEWAIIVINESRMH